jgi:hypothetical protein
VVVVRDYNPKIGQAEAKTFDRILVTDGVLDIDFGHRVDNPEICAIEVNSVEKD